MVLIECLHRRGICVLSWYDIMSTSRLILLTIISMFAFAGNSVLCRMALLETSIDAASFTGIRLLSGAIMLWLFAAINSRGREGRGDWLSALALFSYAAAFSFAYVQLSTATGALLLFGAVQVTMISYGLWRGERLFYLQWMGLAMAVVGLVGLLMPGLSAPPVSGSVLMVGAGIAWGLYSLKGRRGGDATRISAGNFLRAVLFAAMLSMLASRHLRLDTDGVLYAIASGALTSGLGYAIWYMVLPALKSATAATLQLSVPLIAALGGIVFLGEPITLRFTLASVAILGGIALVIRSRSARAPGH